MAAKAVELKINCRVRLKKNVKIIATSLSGKKFYDEIEYPRPLVVLFGNEGAGLSTEVLALADAAVKVPILGKADSLNVGAAAAVVLYAARIKTI